MLYTHSGALATVGVTLRSMLQACGGIVTVANTTVSLWASSMRLHRITVWPSPSSTLDETVQIQWVNAATGFVKDQSKIRVLPGGVTDTSPCSFSPPPKTLAADWFSDSGSNLFTMTAPALCVWETEFTYTLSGGTGSPTVGAYTTTSTSAVGNVLYPCLGVGKVLIPQGVTPAL